MKTLGLLAGAGMLLASTSAFAACDRYGNCYNNYGNGYSGYNSNTGSQWNSRSSGNTTYGTDSRGNSYNYNRSTGQYYNYGTGEMRSHGRRY